MTYSFNTEVFGAQMKVSGILLNGEFEIETIVHKGEELVFDTFPDDLQADLQKLAFDKALEEFG